jgi:tRNA pseudouridine synthase 10
MLKVRFDPVRPDLNIVVDPFSMMVEVSPTPIYIAGRFRKFKTGFPIRSKLCRVCMGRGCDSCGGLGVREISVEYALMKVAMDLYGCESVKLHLQIDDGRDRVVLGLGRSFILEVRKPKRRSVDLTIFREKLYSMFEGLIDVGELAYTDRKSICQMKASFEPEGYILRLRPMEPVDMVEAIKHLKRLEGLKIKQRYPGFKPRLKTISNLSLQIVDDRSVEVRFTSSEPLHTKSFIEGGRDTKPTITEVTGVAWLPVDTIVYVGGMKHAQLERV